MTQKQANWGDNLTILTDPDVGNLPFILRRTKAFEKVLFEMPITIEDDDLIVGNTVENGVIVRTALPKYATETERIQANQEGNLIEVGLSHKTPYYPTVLEQGLSGIITKIDDKINDITSRPLSMEREEKLVLFNAMRRECSAVIALAHRYADLAQTLAERAEQPRRDELLQIAEVCRRVPEFPASSFHEAVQAFWLVHYALFSTRTKISCGRLDQYLYPYFKKDVDEDTITLKQTQVLLDCLWLRFSDRTQIIRDNFFIKTDKEKASTNIRFTGQVIDSPRMVKAGHRDRVFFAEEDADAINHFGQNLLLSGIKPDGSDGTNELTYLCLNAMEKFALVSPVVTTRLHKASPTELIHRTAEVLRIGGGQPFINSDDALVQAYVNLGVPLEDARDYANSNCWETMIQGKSDQELIRGINFLLYLELALNRGISHVTGQQLGIDTGNPQRFKRFSELMDAWKAQTDYQLEHAINYIGKAVTNGTLEHSNHGKYCHNPFLSALTLDCIEQERDITRGGARYVIWHLMGEALANAIDSMVTIKKLVFEEKTVTLEELLAATASNWKGASDLRQRILSKLPKFSQDNEYADAIGQEMMNYFIKRSRYHAAQYPMILYPCSVGTFSWVKLSGGEVGASPDGRYSGEPVAPNLSPALGCDVRGPTAAIRSYLKMRVADLAAGAPIDLRFSRQSLTGEVGLQRLAGFLKTFIDLGGNMITLTVTEVEELKKAMREPEKYRHLRVRMGGWTAYFVMLSEEQQRIHIQRVEHGLA
jgi:formate C-acetyltransferase